MTDSEQRRFARALWARIDPATNLPVIRPYPESILLFLSEPRKGLAQDRVREYLDTHDISRISTPTPDVGGRERFSYTMELRPDPFLQSWLQATPRIASQKDDGRHITWTLEEISGLFGKITAWWETEGRRLLELLKSPSPYTGQTMRPVVFGRFTLTLEVLRDVVLALSPRNSRIARQALGLVREIQRHGMPIHAVLPAFLKYTPNGSAEIARETRHGLLSSDEFVYLEAARGLIFWLRSQEPRPQRPLGFTLPASPSELRSQLGFNLACRRQPGLEITLDALGNVFSGCPSSVDESLRESVLLGLDELSEEVNYRTTDDSSGLIRSDQVPEYRLRIARLLKALGVAANTRFERLNRLITSLRDDPLPEVRTAMEQGAVDEP